MGGLLKKTDDVEFMNVAVKHDIIAIYETLAVADKSEDVKRLFFNHFCELNPAVKLSKYSKASGGVAVYVTNTLKTQVNRINNDFKFGVIFTVCKSILKQAFDLVLMCIYCQPEGSPVYKEQENGIEILFNEILNVQCAYPSHKILIIGDLNARIGQNQDFISHDSVKCIPQMNWYEEIENVFSIERKSKDIVVNNFGKHLLESCKEMGLFVLNGRCLTDSEGEYTYISSTGKSIIDYFITEPEIYDLFTQFYVSDMDIGDHLPVIGYIGEKEKDPKICISKNVHKLESCIKFKWQPNHVSVFCENLTVLCSSNHVTNLFKEHADKNETSNMVQIITDMIQDSASLMKVSTYEKGKKYNDVV